MLKKILFTFITILPFTLQSQARDIEIHGSSYFGEQCSLILRNHKGSIYASPLVRSQNGHSSEMENLWFLMKRDSRSNNIFVGDNDTGSKLIVEAPRGKNVRIIDAIKYEVLWRHGNHHHKIECLLNK